jgi:hypothetical protein
VAGAIVIVVLLVVVIPVVVLMSGAIGSAVLGGLLKRDRDIDNVDADGNPNEYLALSESDPYRN